MNKKAFLIVLDGWGIGQKPSSDAVFQARTPYFDKLMTDCPNSRLVTYGEQVGLPSGQMGNSEVGHLNLGAGRIVYQDLTRIDKIFEENRLNEFPEFNNLVEYCRQSDKPCHLIGLVSDGGVHSHFRHLCQLIEKLEQAGLQKIFLHVITDGRDTDPESGLEQIRELEKFLDGKNTQIASLIGRYYAMDRDKRWERIEKAYELFVSGKGKLYSSTTVALEKSYREGVTDEFVEACKIGDPNQGLIQPDDAVFCFNFRTDRLRQLTQVLSQKIENAPYTMEPLPLYFLTMTRYDSSFKNIRVLFEAENLQFTLGECLARYGLSQLRIAETEKYPHVSYFFSGGREKVFTGEKRILIPSPKVATYDLQPEMSANEVCQALMNLWAKEDPDFICLNFANTDMVGHTGVFEAAMKAAETVDHCLEKIVEKGKEKNYNFIILADHGNADYMINEDGSPNTAHTMNPVPCILVSNDKQWNLKDGKLADIAPTLLKLMELPVPVEMTGESLLTEME